MRHNTKQQLSSTPDAEVTVNDEFLRWCPNNVGCVVDKPADIVDDVDVGNEANEPTRTGVAAAVVDAVVDAVEACNSKQKHKQ